MHAHTSPGNIFGQLSYSRAISRESCERTDNAFVIKLNSVGTPIYSTYLGGSGGSVGEAISADARTAITYVAAQSGLGFPLVDPIQGSTTDISATVSKLNPTGSTLAYSTYLGEVTFPVGIQVDSAGQAYVAGYLFVNQSGPPSGSLPVVAPIQRGFGAGFEDSFVSVINSTGMSLAFSSYVGGDSDAASGLGIDSQGNIYLSGDTLGSGNRGGTAAFPILNATSGVYVPFGFNSEDGVFEGVNQTFLSKILLSAGSSPSYPTTVDFLRRIPSRSAVQRWRLPCSWRTLALQSMSQSATLQSLAISLKRIAVHQH